MGGVKQMMIEYEESNIGFIKDTFVCTRHISDYAVRNFIKKSTQKGKCSYCDKKGKVVTLIELMDLILFGIGLIYEDAANWMSYDSEEGGYLGKTYDNYELIDELLEIDKYELQQDITNGIADITWSTRNDYYSTEAELLDENWKLFKEVVKYKNRYLFTQSSKFKTDEDNRKPFDVFNNISSAILPLNLLTKISIKTKLFRARQHNFEEKVETLIDIASTPKEYAVYSNRMSPAGISMFYCTFDKETSKLETVERNKDKTHISIGTFLGKKEFCVIDFTRLFNVSVFDKEKQAYFYISQFLKSFIKDLSKDIQKDGKEHIEYVPTQIVTEFFRYVYSEANKISIDGIVYPSSKSIDKNACVLFFDSDECIKELQLVKIESNVLKF
ncbi:HEPN-associated N-terminal domain-containing protein [Flavobacterium aestuarii]|uniref:HEPN-associated N-terminal domain-containing protein n=1 Tax=Flavobacterium aestuarii TaxID=3149227 RepID=UPI0032B3C7A2